jgi:hypothetical protein
MEIQKQLQNSKFRGFCSVGVATGECYCGLIGTKTRREFIVFGKPLPFSTQLALASYLCVHQNSSNSGTTSNTGSSGNVANGMVNSNSGGNVASINNNSTSNEERVVPVWCDKTTYTSALNRINFKPLQNKAALSSLSHPALLPRIFDSK